MEQMQYVHLSMPALINLTFVQFALLRLHEEGLNSYIRAIKKKPWNLDIHVNLSGVLAQLGNFSEALRTLQHLQGIHTINLHRRY